MPTTAPPDRAPAPVPWPQWQHALARAPGGPFRCSPGTSLLVLAAHPDDEAIGAGRLIADHPGPKTCLTLSAGEGCFGTDADEDLVATIRLTEWIDAAVHLGLTPEHTPRWPDGRLAEFEDEMTELIVHRLRDHDVLLAPWCHDPHPDHRAIGRAAARAAAATATPLLAYPIWTPYWLSPDDVRRHGSVLVTTPSSARADSARDAAVACHRSQLDPRPPARLPVVPEELLRRHRQQLLVGEAGDD